MVIEDVAMQNLALYPGRSSSRNSGKLPSSADERFLRKLEQAEQSERGSRLGSSQSQGDSVYDVVLVDWKVLVMIYQVGRCIDYLCLGGKHDFNY